MTYAEQSVDPQHLEYRPQTENLIFFILLVAVVAALLGLVPWDKK